jgi:PTH1 family peptidyl-tRNA hydrolase
MKLVVGLGNPGRKYEQTRHNVGFRVLDELVRKHSAPKAKRGFQGEFVDVDLLGQRTFLLWPHTYMNNSGGSALAARDFYKLNNEDLLIVCDDMNLPLAKLRLRASGSAGGQNGLADVIRRLGTNEIARLRVGVEAPGEHRTATDHVLGKFSKTEKADIDEAIWRAADAVECWARKGVAEAMNQYN